MTEKQQQKTLSITIADVIVIHRTIEIPHVCPECKHPIMHGVRGEGTLEPVRENTLTVYQYMAESQAVYAMAPGEDESHLEWDGCDGGDNSIPVSWQCRNCEYDFGTGEEIFIDTRTTPKDIADALLTTARNIYKKSRTPKESA